MVKSRLAVFGLALTPLLAACGTSLTVEVHTEGAEGATTPVANLEVEILPYDRDSLFAVLISQADSPEPQVPAAIQSRLDSVRVLQATWREVEGRWNEVRDSLRTISGRIESMDRRSREYREAFDSFNSMEGRERSLNNQRQAAFDEFTNLQSVTQGQLDSVRAVIESWEDIAFADFADVQADLLSALGQDIHYDTTDASGRLTATLSSGDWWVHARVTVPTGELYWNVLTGGVDTLRLTPDNAERRLSF